MYTLTCTLIEGHSPEFTPGDNRVDVILERIGICWCFDVIKTLSVINIEEGWRGEN